MDRSTENPKASYQMEKKLRRWQRAQARRQKGSRGWWEAQRKIDKCQRRIRGLRRHDAQHQMTSTVTKKFSDLVIEDLNVAGLMRGNTPRAQADAGMGDIKRQLIYKGQWRHTEGDPGAPCGSPAARPAAPAGPSTANLKREPMWNCPNCGTRHDRNLNAAINLRNLIVPAGRGRNGRGQECLVPQQGDLQRLRDREPENGARMEADAPQAWKRGSPNSGHVPKATPEWARSGADSCTGAFGFTPGSSRQRSQAETSASSG